MSSAGSSSLLSPAPVVGTGFTGLGEGILTVAATGCSSVLLREFRVTLSVGGAGVPFFLFLPGVVAGVVGVGSGMTMSVAPLVYGLMFS